MKALIVHYRQSRTRQKMNQMIIKVDGVSSKEDAEKLVGKKVTWTSPAGKEIKGEVRSAHGNSGAIRVLFESGMPGQAIGQEVTL